MTNEEKRKQLEWLNTDKFALIDEEVLQLICDEQGKKKDASALIEEESPRLLMTENEQKFFEQVVTTFADPEMRRKIYERPLKGGFARNWDEKEYLESYLYYAVKPHAQLAFELGKEAEILNKILFPGFSLLKLTKVGRKRYDCDLIIRVGRNRYGMECPVVKVRNTPDGALYTFDAVVFAGDDDINDTCW